MISPRAIIRGGLEKKPIWWTVAWTPAKSNWWNYRVPVPRTEKSPFHKILLSCYNISWFQSFVSKILNKSQQGIDMVIFWSFFGQKPFNGKQRKKRLICENVFPMTTNLSQASRVYTLWSSMAAPSIEAVFAFNLVKKRAKSNKLKYFSMIIEFPVVLLSNICP